MRVIGITGGVGAGKSRILAILEAEYGAQIIEADLVARELEEPGQEGLRLLTEEFGDGILDLEGRLDRAAFAALIFRDPAALKKVNDLIHPLTWKAIERKLAGSTAPVAAVEAALFDEKTKHICQELWYVDTDDEIRIARLMEGRGYSREKCLDIMKNQASREEFLRLADAVIDNSGTIEDVRRQIAELLRTCSGTEERHDNGCAAERRMIEH